MREHNTDTYGFMPALGCEEFYYKNEEVQADGSRKAVYERTTSKVVLGEPDPQLFVINESYIETKPSAALNALVQRVSVTPNAEESRRIRGARA